MEELKEKSLHPPKPPAVATAQRTQFSALDPEVQLAVRCAAEKKATDMVVLDLRQIASFAEYFIIASGANQRQVQAVSDEIAEQVKKQLGTRPIRIEGYNTAEWVLMDYGDFIVHIFNKDAREFYDLERLWRDAGKVALPESL
ncbi:MAG TPA: ribosome silencing factor [Pyrinomonadaceae bacterium]